MWSLLQFSKEDIVTLNICCSQFTDVENEEQKRQDILPKAMHPRSDPDGTNLGFRTPEPIFFFPMMPLCLAGHKDPFLLHSLTTPKPKCSTVNLRNKEPWSQCLELSALAKYILVGGTFYLLFVVFKQRENLTRVPFPIRKTQQLEPLWNKKAGRF